MNDYEDEPETEGEAEGFNIDVHRDADTEDWYIQVKTVDGGYIYDGWWKDSANKTAAEAIAEAMRGAQI